MYKTTNCIRRNGSAKSFKSIIMLLMLFVGFGSYAQYCEVSTTYSGDYLSSITTTNALQNVSYTASSQPADSYDDKTDQVIMQSQGLSFDISTTYVGGGNGVNVWIDFDGDEEFDDEEKVFSLANSDATKTGTITIPSVVAIGEYRMRVRSQYGSTANPSACGNVTYGSTVDFTLSVTEAPDCMPPSGLTATALSLTSMELSWTSDGDSFEVEWGEAGFEQGDGTTEVVTDTSLEVTTVTDTPYDFYVRQNCGDDGYSMWAGPFSFETGYCTPTYSYGCSGGAKISNVTTSDAILNIANETGSSSCGANGYNDFTSMSASSPAEAVVGITVGVGSYSGGVKVWIDWNNNGEFETDELMAESASTITSGSSFTGSFTVPAGTPLGDYRIRVRVVEGNTSFDPCSNYSYGETEDYTFTVIEEPDCMPPTGLGIESATYTSANLSWVSSGDLFDIEWGEAGFEQGDGTMVEGVTENPYTLEGLEAETGYEFYVRQDCGDDGVSLWAGPYYFYTGYCQGSSTYTGNRINGFATTAGYTNISNMDNGTANDYNNYTNLSVTQSEGGSFDYSVSVPSYTNVEIWIDFNNNLTFDTDELVAEHTYASSATIFTGTIDIPENIDEGDYRIRVRSRYYYNTAASPCNDLSYGETEDYTLTIVPEPDCLPPTELAATALSLTSMELSWTSDGDSFEVEWGEAGFEQGDGTIEIVTGTSLEVTTVIDTPYEFYVRQNCGTDGYSLWAGPFSFETGYCDPTYSFGCSNGSKISNFETNDAIMNIANNTGTSECGEDGYNNFTSMIAAAPENLAVSFTVGVGSYSGGVKIWIDWNNNGTFETGELIAESSATITAGNEFTGTFSVPAGTPLGNYRMRVRVVEGNTSFDPCSNYSYGETEDYTFSVIEPPTCFPPSGVTIVQVTEDSIEVSWTAPAEQDSWQVIAVPAGSPAPDEDTTGYETADENPYIIEGLDPSTEYDVYVRANCGDEDGISLWAGPATTTTTQIPAEVDFEDDFEEEGGWTFISNNETNQWYVGTATAYAGNTSLYITNDGGATNAYSDTQTVTHAIRDLSFPVETNEAVISFYWKTLGHLNSFGDNYDMLRVWLMPSNYQPQPGVVITADDGGIQIGGDFVSEEDWILFQEVYNLNDFADNVGRLIFEWRNNTYTNNPPPAAIDNVEVKLVTCSRPIEVVVEKNQVTGDLLASWTPVAGETQWEVIVQLASDPAPDDTATGVIVDEPQYLIEDVVEGELYKIYVRAICSEDDKSLWTEGVDFSDFNPPACANIDLEFPDLVMDDFGDFIFCAADGELTLDLVADFDASSFKATTSYEVEEIEYAPPFPFLGGIEMPITSDDDYTASFDLPFNFCFYGESYSYCRIGDNGVVTFGMPYTTTYGEFCPYSLNGPVPSTDFNMKNSIMGIYHDMHTTNNPGENTQINYQVLGTYPCRALVVNFNEVPSYGFSCTDEEYRTTTQIVLYEITNIIEVYVQHRNPCTNSTSGGQGVLGLINADGSEAITPPDRNTGTWSAQEEAWRFSPSADTTVEFGWYINGEFYSDNPNDQITVTGDTCVEARVTYPGCGGEDLVLSKEYCVKVAPEIVLDQPEDIKVCLIDGQYDPINLFDKSDEAVATLSQNENFDINDYDITFYHSEDAAIAETNAIPNPTNYVPDPDEYIWIRVEHESTGCNAIISFRIYEGVGLALKRPADVILCVYYDIIPETDLSRVNDELLSNLSGEEELIVNYYHSQQDAINGNNPITDWDSFIAPSLPYEVWIKVSGSAEVCEAVTSFRLLEGEGLPEYEHVDFDICTAYVLPELPEGYFYTTEYLAEGDRINPGTVIEGLGLHTIYVNVISKEGCITSSSYNVNIIECSVPRGISPNGDGLNDRFELTDYFLLDLKIYNRDGREVYSHGMGYTNEWEGQSNNGSLLPDGTYYYRIVTPVEELTGWVQLVRELK